MNFTELNIASSYLIEMQKLGDARGFFGRVFCEDEFLSNGLNTVWPQTNLSFSKTKGTLRGLHFQRAPASEVKVVRAIQGRVLDVLVDLRLGSETFGQHCTVTLDADRKNAVYIPAGCAHGFQTLCDDVELFYMHSQRFSPQHEGGINPQDPALGIDWPLPISQISERDAALPNFKDCEPFS